MYRACFERLKTECLLPYSALGSLQCACDACSRPPLFCEPLKTGGRVKGVPNKLTTGAKEVIAQVVANIGSVARMTEWVHKGPENEKAFWTNIYTKLLPLQGRG
jgi:hypothetical protein